MTTTKSPPKWKEEKRALADLKPNPKNPRIIDPESKEFKDTQESLEKFGMAEPIVINKDNTIIGGHARHMIEQLRKTETVQCWVPNRQLTDDEVSELTVRLNKNIAGKWDPEKLIDFGRDVLIEWGFTAEDIDLSFDLLPGSESGQEKTNIGADRIGELVKFETMMRPDERTVVLGAINHIKENHPSHTTLADCLVYLANMYTKSLEGKA